MICVQQTSKQEKNKEWPRMGYRVVHACEKNKLMRKRNAVTLALIALKCSFIQKTVFISLLNK